MTYFVLRPLAPPHQQRGQLIGWEGLVTTLGGRSDIGGIWKDGRGILNPSEMPEAVSLMWLQPLPPVFSSYGGIIICNEKLKFVLEEFDPGIHQFIPIKVGFRSGESATGNYFILNVHHMLDSIIDEKTKADQGSAVLPDNPARHFKYVQGFATKDGDVTVCKSKLTSVNLWRELAYTGLYMMSDRLQQRLKHERLSFFDAHKATEL
jgi:hypothetical protein